MKNITNIRESRMKQTILRSNLVATKADNASVYLAQAKAMVDIAVGVQFENFDSRTIQDFCGGLSSLLFLAENELTTKE